jgi:hypothetical protein
MRNCSRREAAALGENRTAYGALPRLRQERRIMNDIAAASSISPYQKSLRWRGQRIGNGINKPILQKKSLRPTISSKRW